MLLRLCRRRSSVWRPLTSCSRCWIHGYLVVIPLRICAWSDAGSSCSCWLLKVVQGAGRQATCRSSLVSRVVKAIQAEWDDRVGWKVRGSGGVRSVVCASQCDVAQLG